MQGSFADLPNQVVHRNNHSDTYLKISFTLSHHLTTIRAEEDVPQSLIEISFVVSTIATDVNHRRECSIITIRSKHGLALGQQDHPRHSSKMSSLQDDSDPRSLSLQPNAVLSTAITKQNRAPDPTTAEIAPTSQQFSHIVVDNGSMAHIGHNITCQCMYWSISLH